MLNQKVAREAITRPATALGWRPAALILSIALAARLFVAWFVIAHFSPQWFFHRGLEMGLLAQSIIEGHGLSSPFGVPTGPTAFIAPGYPLFVACVFKVFGSYTLPSELVILTIHIVLNLLTILIMMNLGLQLAGRRAAWLAGLFWAVSLPLVWIPSIFWETSFSCFFAVGSVAFALRLRDRPSYSGFALSGALMAIAALFNPAMLPMFVAMLLWVTYCCRDKSLVALPLSLVVFAILFAPWPLRNARLFHAFIPLRSTVGFEMWMGNRPHSDGYLEEALFPTYNSHELSEYRRLGEVAYIQGKSEEAKRFIYSHPARFVSLTLARLVRFWTGNGNANGSPVYVLHACATTLFGFMGIAALAQERRPTLWIWLLPLLLFPIPYYITHAEFRYRLIVDPLLTVLAAYSVAHIYRRYRVSPSEQYLADARPRPVR